MISTNDEPPNDLQDPLSRNVARLATRVGVGPDIGRHSDPDSCHLVTVRVALLRRRPGGAVGGWQQSITADNSTRATSQTTAIAAAVAAAAGGPAAPTGVGPRPARGRGQPAAGTGRCVSCVQALRSVAGREYSFNVAIRIKQRLRSVSGNHVAHTKCCQLHSCTRQTS